MNADIVFPNENEEEFIAVAEKLGYDSLIFVYGGTKIEKIKNKNINLQKKTKIKISIGALADPGSINKSKMASDAVFVESSDKDRQALEKFSNFILFGLEKEHGKDYIHHRSSGLNHILCGLAKKNHIKIAFSFNNIINAENKVKLIGRIGQNIRLCRKYKVEMIFASFAKKPYELRPRKDMLSFFSLS